jgi:methyltransferase-like protein/cyclopropane fatty-acyl-phospholipid synthase-like methyltransferase
MEMDPKKNAEVKLVLSKSNNIYDEVPYESYSYPLSHPYHLMTLGALFGVKSASPDKARVLELGCAAGGNLIPHAVNNPNAKFIGVDSSKVEIDEALKCSTQLGLKNIEFHNCSIVDINDKFGKFDYIICHGVISWVPEFVRAKIFEICKKNLNENGIAYISYNTLPGWNMIRTIRDMMLYHANMFANVGEKITQARALLEFVKDSLENSKSPYAEVLKAEAALLAKQSDHYLCHDHLEEDNKQYYFYEFMEEAKKHNLQYLSDCNISTMYLGNMPAKAAEKLQTINDIVRTEQYMDFITNRRFRSTLLCHDSIQLNRRLDANEISKYNMVLNLVPESSLNAVNINDNVESLTFFYNGNKESKIATTSAIMKAIFYTFYENINNPISFDTLISLANKKLKLKEKTVEQINNEFLNNAISLVLQGYMRITIQSSRKNINIHKPKLGQYALYQIVATSKMWLTNLMHEVVGINMFEKFVYRYLDGKNDKKQLLDLMMQHVKKGDITLNRENQKIEDLTVIRKEMLDMLEAAINKAFVSALLV